MSALCNFNVVGNLDVFGTGQIAVIAPKSEVELIEAFARAQAEGLRLLPIGGNTKLHRSPPGQSIDLLVNTRHFGQVIAFEPGDGTLTAGGGARIDDLAQLCQTGSRSLVPELTPQTAATLGGLIATAESGADRLARGPIREHVLGLRVLLANGQSSRSGGRLVKNVAGFDLHRLHTGAWGGLGLILEATLRLFPAWQTQQRVQIELDAGLGQACSMAQAIGQLENLAVAPKRVFASQAPGQPDLFHVDLAGREDVVAAQVKQLQNLFAGITLVETTPFEPRAQLILQGLPSQAAQLAALATQLPAESNPTIHFDPLLARLAVRTMAGSLAELLQLWPQLPPGIQRMLPRQAPPQNLAGELARQMETALDPRGLFARS